MNYKKNYDDYIKYIKTKRPIKYYKHSGYFGHHIIPKSFGGEGVSTDWSHPNIVALTAREHFLAHYLLIKIYEGLDENKYQKMLFAFTQMNRCNDRTSPLYLNSKLYEIQMKKAIEKRNNINRGKKRPGFIKAWLESQPKEYQDWFRWISGSSTRGKKLRKRTEKENLENSLRLKEWYKTHSSPRKGKKLTIETRNLISQKLKGKHYSEESALLKSINSPRRKPVKCIETKQEFLSCSKAAKAFNVNACIIQNRILKETDLNGFHFIYI